jgi:two-component system nitrogen regulation response regulator GlnG
MSAAGRVLLAEDDRSLRLVVGTALVGQGHTVVEATTAHQALELATSESWDVAVVDIGLPGGSGLSVLEAVGERIPVIVITARSTMDNAVAAMRAGAFEYLTKPFDLEEIEDAVARAVAEGRQAPGARAELDGGGSDRVLVGRSKSMQRVFKAIGRAAARAAPVLIEGASGTGKELVARTIHRYSERADGPFVAVNMAALPESLAEAELFGHERGAYTGAAEARVGLVRAADRGTLFLDEVAELALPLQAKLLRVLEESEVTPLGSTRPKRVSVRIISATHRDLAEDVAAGRFRADLYYRLYVLPIALPPLRERREDIPELVGHLLSRLSGEPGGRAMELAPEALAELQRRPWPGNVRELMNVLMRAIAFSDGPVIRLEDLDGVAPAPGLDESLRQLLLPTLDELPSGALHGRVMAAAESALLGLALERCQGNQVRAAKLLGIHRNTLRQRLRALGLRAHRYRGPSKG